MDYTVVQSASKEDFEGILQLRYKILREPWARPFESSGDELEGISTNAMIKNKEGKVIACGRLQLNEDGSGQVRYMAVDEDYRGRGLGKKILHYLEDKASVKKIKTMILQAREKAVSFYLKQGYTVEEKSFLLWGEIQHYRMRKTL